MLPFRAKLLASIISDLCRNEGCEPWMHDAEFVLWARLKGHRVNWAAFDQLDLVNRLFLLHTSEDAHGWVLYDESVPRDRELALPIRFVSSEEWDVVYLAWRERNARWLEREPAKVRVK